MSEIPLPQEGGLPQVLKNTRSERELVAVGAVRVRTDGLTRIQVSFELGRVF